MSSRQPSGSSSGPQPSSSSPQPSGRSSGPGVGSVVIWRDEEGREVPGIVLSADQTPDGLALVAAAIGRDATGRLALLEVSGAESDGDGPGWRAT